MPGEDFFSKRIRFKSLGGGGEKSLLRLGIWKKGSKEREKGYGGLGIFFGDFSWGGVGDQNGLTWISLFEGLEYPKKYSLW